MLSGAAIALSSSIPAALAADGTFDSPECRAAAVKLSQDTGALFVEFGAGKRWAFFHHPFAGEFIFRCDPGRLMKLEFTDKSPAPSMPWYDTAAVAAMSVGADMGTVEESAKRCIRDALVAENRQAIVKRKPLMVTCTVTDEEPYRNRLSIYSYSPAEWEFWGR